jgi:phospholipid/cholesterol/gamma-HCH transport system substrate-binding protein
MPLPSRKEIQWSQLRVGSLVLVAMVVLVGLIFLLSRSSGGLFAPKISFRSYFDNAAGLKNGAPVTLEGVTIGNVIAIKIVAARNPTPVEVTMRVGEQYLHDLHTDSTTQIAQAGVLGDSYIDIDSTRASGPQPSNHAELKATQAPTIQSVISRSQGSIDDLSTLLRKAQILIDSLNSKTGVIGALINDPALLAKINHIATNLDKTTAAISQGQGTLGKLLNDDTLYSNANATIARLNNVAGGLEQGKGTAGKLLKDDSLYNNLDKTVTSANELISQINSGKGSLGKLARDPAFAQKLDDAVTRLDSILQAIDAGKGTIGQLVQNRSLYDHTDQTMDQTQQLIKAIREDPKKYFVIRLKVF